MLYVIMLLNSMFYMPTIALNWLQPHEGSIVDFLFRARAFQSEGEAVGKIIRAKQSSCQLSTYFVGRTAFYKLRQAVQR